MVQDSVLDGSALEQARLIRERQLTSTELTGAYLDRIERLNPTLNSFVAVFHRRALAAARVKDAMLRARGSRALPPFHGVPIGIKDLNVVRGARTRFGSKAMPSLVLPVDDHNVAQLRRGGFVILGKLSTSELGAMPVTEPSIHGPTRNPWSHAHTAGGSSGGSGSAVAAGMLPLAHASDGAGSIRIPAAFCHLFGLKPSRGRVKNQFGFPDERILYTSGPISRTVEDAAAMLDVLAGILDGRTHWAPRPEAPFLDLARRAPRRMKIRFSTRSTITSTHPEIAAAVERAAHLLASLGHEVEPGELPEGTLESFLPLWQYLIAKNPLARWDRAQPITRWLAETGRDLRGRDVFATQEALTARIRPALEAPDIWLTPTVSQPPPPIGAFDGEPAEAFRRAAELGAFTAFYNLTGQPAASVPFGFTTEGLPIGLQIGARAYAEGDVLTIARQLEEIIPWRDRTPATARGGTSAAAMKA